MNANEVELQLGARQCCRGRGTAGAGHGGIQTTTVWGRGEKKSLTHTHRQRNAATQFPVCSLDRRLHNFNMAAIS